MDSANSPIFGAILSNTVFQVFVCGIQNSEEDQRIVAKLRNTTILILAYRGIRLQGTECTNWSRKVRFLSLSAPAV